MEVAFKKKAPRKAGGRKRSRREAEAEDADVAGGASEDKEDTLGVIEQVLEDQRLRAQMLKQEAASRAASDARGSSSARGKAAAASDSAEYGLHDPKKDGSAGQKLLTLLDGQFTGQSSVTQQDPHEQLLCVSAVPSCARVGVRLRALKGGVCCAGRSTLRRSCTASAPRRPGTPAARCPP